MAIQIQRGRQFVSGTEAQPLFDRSGQRGEWLSSAAKKLIDQGVAVKLQSGGSAVELRTQADWDNFLDAHASSLAQSQGFASEFGITFQDFVEVIDDAAASSESNIELDLSPTSTLAQALSLDTMENNYAANVAGAATVDLGGGVQGIGATGASIGPDIMAHPVAATWDRDRTEQESWADFIPGPGTTDIFNDNTGPEPFEKLYQPKWDDAEAMDIVNEFTLPLHVEVESDSLPGSPEFQDNREMFRETYYDDHQGSLKQAGASVRARVRFDNNAPYDVRRVLVQAKEGREVDPTTGRSAVRKFEKRWENNTVTEAQAQEALVSGRQGGDPMAVSQKLYEVVQQAGTLPADGQLRLEPKSLVLQKRRRTHLFMEPLNQLTARRDALQKEVEAASSPDPRMVSYLEKLNSQVALITDMNDSLKKYGRSARSVPSGETFIISADRFNVYDPASRTTLPNELDDDAGSVGSGLHVEAEWDSASSDKFEEAIEEIDKRLATNPANAAELTADREKIEGFRELFRRDVEKTVEVQKRRLLNAGLELDPSAKSKEERASDFMAQATERPLYWV